MTVFVTPAKTRTEVALFTAAIALALLPLNSMARGPRTNPRPHPEARASDCSPAQAFTEIALNNVRARIETGGNLWQDRSTNSASYEIPRTPDRSGPSSIFAGALWLGGESPDNQLKLAAVQFRGKGNDYWPGPLTLNEASVSPATCLSYDRTWRTTRQDVIRHEAFYRCVMDPECNELEEFPNGYTAPTVFHDWPAHGGQGQSYYLAPFHDSPYGNVGVYDPADGDYPLYELDPPDVCIREREDVVPLFGDENVWWIFNDKGSIHSESGGQPIGMEIRAQAFAFSTNDEVNNMTFYNYTLINQGTQTLLNTYFGQWVDVDLGCPDDDYVGCDVQRGLGYAFNGADNDEDCNGIPGYGFQPPAVGVDFFEGPFQDFDERDNVLTDNLEEAYLDSGIVYPGIGIGYGDTIPDNERFGMRAFVYHNIGDQGPRSDPQDKNDYYNYLRARWRDGSHMVYCGTGHYADPEAEGSIPTNYMFPGDSDPLNWATGGIVPPCDWREDIAGNPSGDRRFLESAGPFTLEPGAWNNLTVGVVWARATAGGPYASVTALRVADDKAQALFDNCFRILDGPIAPDLTIQELDQELILYITDPNSSNDPLEDYDKVDPTIPTTASDRSYRFQGYQIYQVIDATVTAADLHDVNRARLVAQCDIEDEVVRLINYEQDPLLGLPVPREMVNGNNDGIRHSFRLIEDAFASGDPRLINFKTYRYMAVAYAHNNWQNYSVDLQTGQARPYLASRRSSTGAIKSEAGIPHSPAPEAWGTVQTARYGDVFPITRIEGQGQGALPLDIDAATENAIVHEAPWRSDVLRYRVNRGPIVVKVIDPLKVPDADFELFFRDGTPEDLSDARWTLFNLATGDSVQSLRTIAAGNEQLVLPWGIAVEIAQHYFERIDVELDGDIGEEFRYHTPPVEASITFADPTRAWLGGVPDGEGNNAFNWIRSGSNFNTDPDLVTPWDDYGGVDPEEQYEELLGGTWAPWVLCGQEAFQPGTALTHNALNSFTDLRDVPSVLVVITPDPEKWSRAPVFEMCAQPDLVNGVEKMMLRGAPSVDKTGAPDGSGSGMGWFPGYAIDLNTGERLNIGFGEDSFWGNGNMRWDPSDQLSGMNNAPIFGGQHWIFVFRNARRMDDSADRTPQYDEGAWIHEKMQGPNAQRAKVWRSIAWVGSSLLVPGHELFECEARITLNVARPYEHYVQPFPAYEPAIVPQRNGGLPLYAFSTSGLATLTHDLSSAESALDEVAMVPNPYFSFSGYESSRLDMRVRFINLPQECTISIYTVSGTLVRRYRKDNSLTYLDWDLQNAYNLPIAGGTYVCHVDAPGIGERVIKWFGVLRPVDLQDF
jgi:hypothetical protein